MFDVRSATSWVSVPQYRRVFGTILRYFSSKRYSDFQLVPAGFPVKSLLTPLSNHSSLGLTPLLVGSLSNHSTGPWLHSIRFRWSTNLLSCHARRSHTAKLQLGQQQVTGEKNPMDVRRDLSIASPMNVSRSADDWINLDCCFATPSLGPKMGYPLCLKSSHHWELRDAGCSDSKILTLGPEVSTCLVGSILYLSLLG